MHLTERVVGYIRPKYVIQAKRLNGLKAAGVVLPVCAECGVNAPAPDCCDCSPKPSFAIAN